MPPLDHEQGICAPTFIIFCGYLSKRETFYNPTNYKLTFSQQCSPIGKGRLSPGQEKLLGADGIFGFLNLGIIIYIGKMAW
jgi:hypothetical protein